MYLPKDEPGWWAAGVLFKDGRVGFILSGHTSRAQWKSWVKRDSAAKHALNNFKIHNDRFVNYRKTSHRPHPPSEPLCAIVRSHTGIIEPVVRPHAVCDRGNIWWAVLVPGTIGRNIVSLHGDRKDAQTQIDNTVGARLGIASAGGEVTAFEFKDFVNPKEAE
jgi:hypothetical protein